MIENSFPSAMLIKNKENEGFSKANNKGILRAKGRYILLLNPDTVVDPQTFSYAVKFMDTYPRVGALTCRVELTNGQLDWASHRGFPTPWAALTYFLGLEKIFPKIKIFSQYHLSYKNLNEAHEIDSGCGAFFLIRREALDQIGLLDEDYFMYAEDLDLSYRLKQAGWKIMYLPDVKVIHYKGVSSGMKRHSQHLTTSSQDVRKKAKDAFYSTMKIFYKKHYWNKYPFFINWLIMLAINLKWKLATRACV